MVLAAEVSVFRLFIHLLGVFLRPLDTTYVLMITIALLAYRINSHGSASVLHLCVFEVLFVLRVWSICFLSRIGLTPSVLSLPSVLILSSCWYKVGNVSVRISSVLTLFLIILKFRS